MIYRIRGHWLVAAFAITFLMRERNKRSCNNLIIARRGKFSGLKSSPHTEATDSLWLRYGLDETTRRKSIIRCARLARFKITASVSQASDPHTFNYLPISRPALKFDDFKNQNAVWWGFEGWGFIGCFYDFSFKLETSINERK